MSTHSSPLDHVRVAAPCPADWNRMTGDEQVRFCAQCSLNVYNLSGMTKQQAEALIMSAEGRLCIRYYQRADGTILTDNCPVGLRALKRRVSRAANAVLSALLAFLAGLGLYAALRGRKPEPVHLQGAISVRPPDDWNGLADDARRLGTGGVLPQPTLREFKGEALMPGNTPDAEWTVGRMSPGLTESGGNVPAHRRGVSKRGRQSLR